MFCSMVFLINSMVLASFWNTLLFRSFHIDHTMKPGVNFHKVSTFWVLEKLPHQFAMLSYTDSLFLSELLKMISIQFHTLSVQLQLLRTWFIDSSSFSHRGQCEGPMNPFFHMISQVRVLWCIKSHIKVLIFGHSSASHTFLYQLTFPLGLFLLYKLLLLLGRRNTPRACPNVIDLHLERSYFPFSQLCLQSHHIVVPLF